MSWVLLCDPQICPVAGSGSPLKVLLFRNISGFIWERFSNTHPRSPLPLGMELDSVLEVVFDTVDFSFLLGTFLLALGHNTLPVVFPTCLAISPLSPMVQTLKSLSEPDLLSFFMLPAISSTHSFKYHLHIYDSHTLPPAQTSF